MVIKDPAGVGSDSNHHYSFNQDVLVINKMSTHALHFQFSILRINVKLTYRPRFSEHEYGHGRRRGVGEDSVAVDVDSTSGGRRR